MEQSECLHHVLGAGTLLCTSLSPKPAATYRETRSWSIPTSPNDVFWVAEAVRDGCRAPARSWSLWGSSRAAGSRPQLVEVSPFLCSCPVFPVRAFSQLEQRSSEVPFLLNVQETTKPQCKMKRGSTRSCAGASARCGGEGSWGKVPPPALAGLPRSVGSVPCWGSVTPSGWAQGFGAAAERGFGIIACPGWRWSGTGLSFTSLCGIVLSRLVWCWGNFSCPLLEQMSRWRVLLRMVLSHSAPSEGAIPAGQAQFVTGRLLLESPALLSCCGAARNPRGGSVQL